jgi:ferrous iron transport protein A
MPGTFLVGRAIANSSQLQIAMTIETERKGVYNMQTTLTTQNTASLGALKPGQSARIRAIQGGHMLCSRLACLGFTPGALVTIAQNAGHGPVIVCLRDTRVALGRGEAQKILVHPVPGERDE